jgi:hypothetical protein
VNCLVIYYQNIQSYNAGILLVISNHIGDIALLIVISTPISEACKLSQEHCGSATELKDKTYN